MKDRKRPATVKPAPKAALSDVPGVIDRTAALEAAIRRATPAELAEATRLPDRTRELAVVSLPDVKARLERIEAGLGVIDAKLAALVTAVTAVADLVTRNMHVTPVTAGVTPDPVTGGNAVTPVTRNAVTPAKPSRAAYMRDRRARLKEQGK